MMTTQKQQEANGRNALKSTGPTTVEGRNRSKLNALKHGLTAAQIVVFDENVEDLENFHRGLVDWLLPIGALEEQLVERIAMCAWRLRRVYRIEARLFANTSKAMSEPDIPEPDFEQYKRDVSRITSAQANAMLRILDAQEERKARARAAAPPSDIGAVFRTLAVSQGPLFQLSRHETTIERSLHRALHDLERLQARRNGEAVMAPLLLDVSSGG